MLGRICFIKEGQRYPDHYRVRDALGAAATVFPTGTPTWRSPSWSTSTCRRSGRSRSCPAA
ncbi:hypothetical protein [Blastococcus brunescens]|uniref:Uncharacterized protein n=1 Tax=Blastococcus brunescens TaxID=1564165 RepID=A0ABZ1AZU1_9ACTN|nr:hypothetical protein [Blastococcus sp. BMG 8361]WRL64004.1 hypothetical protein U6N30_31170 [Blastococcus sp. BMG 8361]